MLVRTDSAGLSAARRHIITLAAKLQFSDDESSDLLLAVGEAMSNAYLHGTLDKKYGIIHLDWQFAGSFLTVHIKDEGSGFATNISNKPYTFNLQGGRGLDIISKTVDEMFIESENGTKLILNKKVRNYLPKNGRPKVRHMDLPD